MFEWISQLPLWLQIIIAIVFIASIIYILILIIYRGIQITKGNLTIKVDGEKYSKYASPHAKCQYSKDIVIIINEIQKILDKKYILIHHDQIQAQMNYAEQKCIEIRLTYQKTIIEKLEQKIENTEILQLNISLIKMALMEIESLTLKILRNAFKINHFADISEKDFTSYLDEKIQYIIAQIYTLLFDLQLYYNNTLIKLFKLISVNQTELNMRISSAINDIFQHARLIALDNKVKLLSYDEEIENIINKYMEV